eukprot:TRINITY_DN4243_c0_g1_i1.p1 TRINITY_DN4243_c0_g1~~TRINITY_DN4243_c0_g1_i1.p1  ORF type:complete len:135 (+),score=4.66 TRINITY_DN4243_c0_g1_i1:81-485(+)
MVHTCGANKLKLLWPTFIFFRINDGLANQLKSKMLAQLVECHGCVAEMCNNISKIRNENFNDDGEIYQCLIGIQKEKISILLQDPLTEDFITSERFKEICFEMLRFLDLWGSNTFDLFIEVIHPISNTHMTCIA